MKKLIVGLTVCALLLSLGAFTVQAAPPSSSSIIHIVQWGENLTFIAARYGTTVHAIMYANGLSNANRIYAGQRLIVPGAGPAPAPPVVGGCVYIVQYGDTLSGIAYKHGITMGAIMQVNGIANPSLIYAGQRLAIPAPGCAPAPAPPACPPACPPPTSVHPIAPRPTPSPPQATTCTYYTVRPGDTLAKIAWRYGVSIWAIVQANNIANPNIIHVGHCLCIPKATAPHAPPPKPLQPGCEHLFWPKAGATLSGVVEMRGTADHANFGYYKFEFRKNGLDEWHYITGGESPVHNNVLGIWDTQGLPNGGYEFRLVIVDRTGNYPPPCEVPVRLHNSP